jgi:hypothetical protein
MLNEGRGLGLLAALTLVSCSGRPASRSEPALAFRPAPVDLGLAVKITHVAAEPGGRVLVQYERANPNPDRYYRISSDGAKTFGVERDLSLIRGTDPRAIVYTAFTAHGTAAMYVSERNLFYTRADPAGAVWTPPVRINDELESAASGVSFVESKDAIYCVWEDRRRGFPLVYSSSSRDGGRTWARNIPIEYDFREGNQNWPKLVAGANGRLIACWEDWRDRQTLVDIRCSASDDGGQRWWPSWKLNDDHAYVWQVGFDLAAQDSRMFALFADFRDPGADGDNDWNLYFTRSEDNGNTWSKNLRLHGAPGKDCEPGLTIDSEGTLYAAWVWWGRSIFGDILLSYSRDGGRSWSPPWRVSGEDRAHYRSGPKLLLAGSGRLLSYWSEDDYRSVRIPLVQLEVQEVSRLEVPREDPAPDPVSPLQVETGPTVFSDDFSQGDRRWEPADGVWVTTKGVYMGADPASMHFSSFARLAEPERYVLQGRFLLDVVAHYRASLYFRADPARHTYYVVSNHFRSGVWLGVREEQAPYAPSFFLDSHPLAQRPFSFRGNRWYGFRLVVTPDRVDYYLDGRLLLSSAEKLKLPVGRIGVGGFANAPTYFDDLSVIALRNGPP